MLGILITAKMRQREVLSLTSVTFRQDLDSYCDGLLHLLDNEVSDWHKYSCMHT